MTDQYAWEDNYIPPVMTPILKEAIDTLTMESSREAFQVLVTALAHTTGASSNWSYTFRLREMTNPSLPDKINLTTLCRDHWDAYCVWLGRLPHPPAICALTLHTLDLHSPTISPPTVLSALITTLVNPELPRITIDLSDHHVPQLPTDLVRHLITSGTLSRFARQTYWSHESIQQWIDHPGAAGLLAPLMAQFVPRMGNRFHEICSQLTSEAYWPELSRFLHHGSTSQRVALLFSPLASTHDITVGLKALGSLKSSFLPSFPPCRFESADWDSLKPSVMLLALTHLYDRETIDHHLPSHLPPSHLIDRAVVSLGLSDQQSILNTYTEKLTRHHSLLENQIDLSTWLITQLHRCDLLSTPERLLDFAALLTQWVSEDPAERRSVGAELLDFVIHWYLHPHQHKDQPPYALSRTLHRLAPPFLVSSR